MKQKWPETPTIGMEKFILVYFFQLHFVYHFNRS